MVKRHQHVEHAVLALVSACEDRDGYANTMGGLAAVLREKFPDIRDVEIVEALKRLAPRYLTLWKYHEQYRRFVQYPNEIGDDEQFFYRADFRMRRTLQTDPQVQALALEINPPEAPMTSTVSEAGRQARFARWEEMGFDRVKADLVQTGGSREVGGSLEVRNLAWEWVHMKEAAAADKPQVAGAPLTLISGDRLEALRKLSSVKFDFSKLVRVCEEINVVYGQGCYCAVAVLTRAVLDHVPPVFAQGNFDDVVNHYGAKSFKEAMRHLNEASRSVADGLLHEQIRRREVLPTPQQVNCGQQLDLLLAEIVRITL